MAIIKPNDVSISKPSPLTTAMRWGIMTDPLGTPGNGYLDLSDILGSAIISNSPSSNQDDYAPSGYVTTLSKKQTIRLGGTTACGIHGLQGGVDGKTVTIMNVGDTVRWLTHETSTSTAANRFNIPDGVAFLMQGDSVTLEYNGTTSRWDVVQWPNRGMSMGCSVFDDFLAGQATVVGSASSGTGASGTGNSSSGIDGTQKATGTVNLLAGTTTTGRALIGSTSASTLTNGIFAGNGAMLSVCRIARANANDGTDTYSIFSGFGNINSGSYDDGATAKSVCGWEYRWNGSAAEWGSVLSDNSATYTRSTTGAPTEATVGSNFYWFIVYIDSGWANADFIYGDAGVFTLARRATSGLPTSAANIGWNPVYLQKKAGTTDRQVRVDLVGFRGNFGARG